MTVEAMRRKQPRRWRTRVRVSGRRASLGDQRFAALRTLADEGDENAVADLFKEYGYEYGRGAV